jgi:hypothetical protein
LRLRLALEMQDHIIRVTLERDRRELPDKPPVQRVMEEDVRQHGRDRRALCAVSGYAQFGAESPMVVGVGLWALGIIRAVQDSSALDVAAMKSREVRSLARARAGRVDAVNVPRAAHLG